MNALDRVVTDAVGAVVGNVAGHLDADRAEHLRRTLLEGPSEKTLDGGGDLAGAVAAWIAALDEPQFGGHGYLSGMAVRPEPLATALTARLVLGIEEDADKRGPLSGLAARLRHRDVKERLESISSRLPQPARSYYLAQVRRIAPPLLRGRETELAELAAFCTGAGSADYRWLQAPKWAGKSALLSTLVLDPPSGVDVVSFFITSRFAGQNDRPAFTVAVLEQLLALTGGGAPAAVPEPLREAHLLELLDDAAGACRAAGRRLVLVVDGLDEDQGVVLGPAAYSIAALLPARLAAGMRVLVAGRPSPPVPDDVPAAHPLRLPGTVRRLERSPFAGLVEVDAKRELDRLLHGDQVERDLLGLLTASGGGLSAADLAELTGQSTTDIDARLATVPGRTLERGEPAWRPGGPPVYSLGHDDLLQIARARVGPERLRNHLETLHTWADAYRERGWPTETPEYLLRGHPQVLVDHGELDRLTAAATDRARHDRMLDLSGGDAAATVEVRRAMDLHLASEDPDPVAMLALWARRIELGLRNNWIPAGLPALWARLGQPVRAVNMAHSITDLDRRAEALVELADAEAREGRQEPARALMPEMQRLLRSKPDPRLLIRATLAAGEYEAAEAIFDRVTADSVQRSWLTDSWRLGVITDLITATIRAGEQDRVQRLIQRAIKVVVQPPPATWPELPRDTDPRPPPSAGFVRVLLASGDLDAARAMTLEMRRDPGQPVALVLLARAYRIRGDLEALRSLAPLAVSLGSRDQPPSSLAGLAALLAAAGDRDRAIAFRSQAWALLDRGRYVGRYIEELRQLADLHAAWDEKVPAHELAAAMRAHLPKTPAHTRADVLALIASLWTNMGDLDRARSAAAEAEATARRASDERFRELQHAVVKALAGHGDTGRAEELARRFDGVARAKALTDVCAPLIHAGFPAQARRVASESTDLLVAHRLVTLPDRDDSGHADAEREWAVRLCLTMLGDPEYDLVTAVRTIVQDPAKRVEVFDEIAAAAIQQGCAGHVHALLLALEQDSPLLGGQLADNRNYRLANRLIDAGAYDRAEDLASRLGTGLDRVRLLIRLATAAVLAADPLKAKTLTRAAEQEVGNISAQSAHDRALDDLVVAAVGLGDVDWALGLARRIERSQVRDEALERMVDAVINKRAAEQAVAITESMISPVVRSRSLARIASAMAAQGGARAARTLARSITSAGWKAHALARMAAEAAVRGEAADAQELLALATQAVDRCDDTHFAVLSLLDLVRAAHSLHDAVIAAALLAQAWSRAASEDAPFQRQVLEYWLQVVAAGGNPGDALPHRPSEQVLLDYAVQAGAGGDEHVEALVPLFASSVAGAHVLAAMASAPRTPPTRRRQLLARAFALSDDPGLLEAAAAVAPEAIASLADGWITGTERRRADAT